MDTECSQFKKCIFRFKNEMYDEVQQNTLALGEMACGSQSGELGVGMIKLYEIVK